MVTWTGLHIVIVPTLLGAGLAACEMPPPPSPEKAALEHHYETGCRPQDAQGWEGNRPYCGTRQ